MSRQGPIPQMTNFFTHQSSTGCFPLLCTDLTLVFEHLMVLKLFALKHSCKTEGGAGLSGGDGTEATPLIKGPGVGDSAAQGTKSHSGLASSPQTTWSLDIHSSRKAV